MTLADKVVLVTGGGRGIGRSIALAFARHKSKVFVTSRTKSEIESVAQEIQDMDGYGYAIKADISQQKEVTRMISEVLGRFHRIDVLVNNAAVNHPKHFIVDITLEEWERTLAVNLRGPFICAKAVLPHMISRRWGRIVNISSIAAKYGAAGRGPYRASKAGLVNLTETLASEVGRFGINVNCILAGTVDTTMVRSITGGVPPKNSIPPDDIAKVAVFLASNDSSSVNGAAIDVIGTSTPLFG